MIKIIVLILLLLVIIFLLENLTIFKYVYTVKQLENYFCNGKNISDIVNTIENKMNIEMLSHVEEDMYLKNLEEMFKTFKHLKKSVFLDNKVIETYKHKYQTEITNAFQRRKNTLAWFLHLP
jgi:biopolymer transport protein ExbB/TolQ